MSIQAQACAATEDCGLSKNSQSNVCTRRRKDASICLRKTLLHHHVISGDLSWALPHLFFCTIFLVYFYFFRTKIKLKLSTEDKKLRFL